MSDKFLCVGCGLEVPMDKEPCEVSIEYRASEESKGQIAPHVGKPYDCKYYIKAKMGGIPRDATPVEVMQVANGIEVR
jgi:hypothetical protein